MHIGPVDMQLDDMDQNMEFDANNIFAFVFDAYDPVLSLICDVHVPVKGIYSNF